MKDPTRSIEDASLPESFRNALAAHVSDRPNAERMARMASHLEQALGMPLAAAKLTPKVPSLALRLAKVWPWLGVGAVVIGAGIWWGTVAQSPVVPAAKEPPMAAPTNLPASVIPAPAAAPLRSEPAAAVAGPAPSAPQPGPPASISAASSTGKLSKLRAARREPVATKHDDAPAELATPAPSTSSDPAAELALLQRAQQQLTVAPARALALAAEHQNRYPDGVFRQERELIAIVALLRRGQLPAAQARAARFRTTFRDSVHLSRLESLMQGDNPRTVLTPMSGKENTSW